MAPINELTVPSTRRIRKSVGSNAAMRKTMDKENATVDVASTLAANRKKSRSKSLGPGGLDALKHANGNRRASIAAPMPRSILKPTAYSVQEIPPLRNGSRRARKSSASRDSTRTMSSSNEDSTNGAKIALRTEEEQQAATREREERERRDARRKSLANRRVSFAAEATLHTFHEIEYLQDSTNSTDSSRRASSASEAGSSRAVPKSPDQQTSHRRNSGLAPASFDSHGEDTLTSVIYSSDSEPADAVEDEEMEENSGSSSDSDDGTMMTIETEEVTGTTIASERYDSDQDTSTLDQVLRAASQRADPRRLNKNTNDGNDGENNDDELDDGEEFIPSFGWAKKNIASDSVNGERQQPLSTQKDGDTETEMDMDMTSAVGEILQPQGDTEEIERDDDMSMDVTRALGGILPQTQSGLDQPSSRRLIQDDTTAEATMEFTNAIGSIFPQAHHVYQDESDTNEDFSMEFTAAMGGVLPRSNDGGPADARPSTRVVQEDTGMADREDTMDLTIAHGGILSEKDEAGETALLDVQTTGMDLTAAIGGILDQGSTASPGLRKGIVDKEVIPVVVQKTPARRSSRLSAASQPASRGSSPGSLGLPASPGKGLHREPEPLTPDTISSPLRTPTPSPSKLSAPQLENASGCSPRRQRRGVSPPFTTSQSQKVATGSVAKVERSPSPSKSPSKSPRSRASVFQNDGMTGAKTPTVVQTPRRHRLSGLGADKSGLGSPQVTALFQRRASISDSATDFVTGRREVAFDDPRALSKEIEEQEKDDEDRENRRLSLIGKTKAPQNNKNANLNLRDMIDNLSPKRNTLKGRKSLHVGSASGLLGKRPAELDDGDESDDEGGVKRLKGHQGSPIKNVKLQQPSSMAETTGRQTRATQRSLKFAANDTTSFLPSSPSKNGARSAQTNPGGILQLHHGMMEAEAAEQDVASQRIHLQDFLKLTSIRFMELNTTKRRHTVAPNSLQDGSGADGEGAMTLERCVVAGACTVPMLELYQHSCRELKNYIAEGRRIVREIEAETLEENPPLFQEYISAAPDVKVLMDSQFKNVKTHARLLSKAMWYEWRMKLQEGLREGLVKIAEDMDQDGTSLSKREALLAAVLPGSMAHSESLEEEISNLEEAAKELADCDPAELEATRDELADVEANVDKTKRLIAELRQQFESASQQVEDLSAQKQGLLDKMQESERIREACRGWTCSEVESLKARVDAIEKQHGWAVTGLAGTSLSMAYKREIEIVLDVAPFHSRRPNSQIDLWYIGDRGGDSMPSRTAAKDFFLQCIRDHVRALPQSRTPVWDLLNIVRMGWDKARFVTSQISSINITFPTNVAKTSDSSVAVTSSLLLTTLRTRVEATLHLHGQSVSQGVEIGVSAQVKVVYGEHFNVGKIGEFLASKIGNRIGSRDEGWSDVLMELQKRLIARGKKQVATTARPTAVI